MTGPEKAVDAVMRRYEEQLTGMPQFNPPSQVSNPTKEYPFATVIPLAMRWRDKLILLGISIFCFAGLACMIRGACDYAQDIWRAL